MRDHKLLPCPFCGGSPKCVDIPETDTENFGGKVITCMGCGAASAVVFPVKEPALPHLTVLWNRRTTPSPLAARRSKK